MTSDDSPPLFPLCNGTALCYAAFYEQLAVNNWYRKRDLPEVRHWSHPEKWKHFKLGLWTSLSDIQIVAADFDELPADVHSFDSLYSVLSVYYQGRAVVTRTYSKKVKAFFAVKLPPKARMTDVIALDTLKSILPENYYAAIDKSKTALSTTFLIPEMVDALSSGLKTIIPFAAILTALPIDGISSNTLCIPQPRKPFRKYGGDFENYPTLKKVAARSPAYEALIRILLATPSLCESKGFDLPSTKLAKETGVLQPAVSKMLATLKKEGLLECSDPFFNPGTWNSEGRKAKTYVAKGELLTAIQELREIRVPEYPLPTRIEDGEWNFRIYQASFHFHGNPDGFRSWVRSIPGHEKKDRLAKVEYVIKQQAELNRSRAA